MNMIIFIRSLDLVEDSLFPILKVQALLPEGQFGILRKR